MAVVVVAEDDANLLAVFTRVLARAGHRVIGCGDGDSALAQIRKRRPDLVLTDVDMPPGMSGLDLAAAIRADPLVGGTPVIVATGGRISAEVGAAFGATVLLRKPVPPSALVAHIETALACRADARSTVDPVGGR